MILMAISLRGGGPGADTQHVVGDDFAAVLAAAQDGCEDSFAVLWRDANPSLLRYLRVLAQESAEAPPPVRITPEIPSPVPEPVAAVVRNPRQFNSSVLERLVQSSDAMSFLGVEFGENGSISGKIDPNEFKKAR